MINLSRSVLLLTLLSASVAAYGQNQAPSGIQDIDMMRSEVVSSATTATNALDRLTILNSWYTLLMNQGFDMSAFSAVRPTLGNSAPNTPEAYVAIEQGYRILEQIQAHPVHIETKTAMAPKPHLPVHATDWPLFHGGQAQTGYSPDIGPQTGQLAWRFPIGHSWYATPTISDGRVYVASPGMTTLAYALDENTGSVLWKARQNGIKIYSSPRVSSGVVVLKDRLVIRASSGGAEESRAPKYLFVLDKKTGKVVQQLDAGNVDYRRGYASVEGNDDYIVYPRSRMELRTMPSTTSMFNTVEVRKASTGEVWWTFRVGNMFGEPTIASNAVFVGTDEGWVYALNLPGPQRERWAVHLDAPVRTGITVVGDTAYAAANNGKLYAMDSATGKIRWTYSTETTEPRAFQFFSRLTVVSGRVYVGAADKVLYCIDAHSGHLVWKQAVKDWIRSRPVVIGKTAYVGTLDGSVSAVEDKGSFAKLLWTRKVATHELLADLVADAGHVLVSDSDLWLTSIDPKDGQTQWHHKLLESAVINGTRYMADRISAGSDYQSSPTAVGGIVYVGGPDRFVHAIEADTGKEVWRFETSGQVSSTPIVADGRVCFGQQGGNRDFNCVDQRDGKPLWTQKIGWGWVGAGYSRGKLFMGTVEGDILAMNAVDGRVLWVHHTNGGVYPALATDQNDVYTGSWDGYYYALDQDTGALKWAYATPGHDYNSRRGGPDSGAPILWQGMVIARVFSATLAAIDKDSGSLRWQFKPPAGYSMNVTPAAHEGRVFVSAYRNLTGVPMDATLFALDDKTGKLIWSFRGTGGWPGASVAKDRVCDGSSTDPFFVCLDPAGNGDGTTNVLWRYQTGGIFKESVPAIYGAKAFILCTDDYLYAFQ